MTGGMMSTLTFGSLLTIPIPPGLCAVRLRVERAVAPNPPASVAADAA
jgi:hypothetical protein